MRLRIILEQKCLRANIPLTQATVKQARAGGNVTNVVICFQHSKSSRSTKMIYTPTRRIGFASLLLNFINHTY